jgi:hypothetical protein
VAHAIDLDSNIPTKVVIKRDHPVHIGSHAPGPSPDPERLGRLSVQPEPKCDLWYLTAVFGLVVWWAAEGRDLDRSRRALRLQRLEASEREDPFAAVIRCTADQAKADKRTRSKWSRVMRYAAGIPVARDRRSRVASVGKSPIRPFPDGVAFLR